MQDTMSRAGADTAMGSFYHKAVENKANSEKAGRPVYDDVVYCRITKPEDKHFRHDAPATKEDEVRFALALAHFKATVEKPSEGTPLNLIPIFTAGQIASLAAAGMTTLEKFAGLEAENVPPDFKELHRKATIYLDAANDKGSLARKCARLEEQNGVLETDNANLRSELAKANEELKGFKSRGAKAAA